MSATRYTRYRAGALSRQSRRATLLSGLHLRLTRSRLVILLAALALLGGCFWLWFRDSPLVSVSEVKIVGLSGPDVPQIQQALRSAAVRMTTLDVDIGRLRSAVEPYPDVRTLTVQTEFPHTVVIHVGEQVPIAQVDAGGRTLAVSRDGTLLQPVRSDRLLPTIPSRAAPADGQLTAPGTGAVLAVLAAAPYTLLTRVESAADTGAGVVIQLRRGPQLRFGDSSQLHAKWAAALAVLGSASSQGASYIDVTDPRRPAAGAATGASGSAGYSGTASIAGTAGAGAPVTSTAATNTTPATSAP